MNRRVVITGMGAVTPMGTGANALFGSWVDRKCGIEDGFGKCREFDPTQYLTRKEARRTDRFTQLALAACEEALEQAEWPGPDGPYAPTKVGCIMGTGIGGLITLEKQYEVLRQRGPKAVSPLSIPMMIANVAAGHLAMRYGFEGINYGVNSACAASAHAIGAAVHSIAYGEADAAIAGGSEAAITEFAVSGFAAMGASSPTGISRPFDKRRDGFVLAEASAVLVLEEGEAAEKRGAPILGEVLGYGATADAFHITAPEPDGRGAASAMKLALQDAEIGPEDVDYINAHGSSTPLNDRSETAAIKHVFGLRAKEIPVTSTKSAIGHPLGAAGAVEAVATVMALNERLAPPTLGYEVPEEGLDLDYVPDGPRPIEPRRDNGSVPPAVAISNSFGFGGHNAVLAFSGAR